MADIFTKELILNYDDVQKLKEAHAKVLAGGLSEFELLAVLDIIISVLLEECGG